MRRRCFFNSSSSTLFLAYFMGFSLWPLLEECFWPLREVFGFIPLTSKWEVTARLRKQWIESPLIHFLSFLALQSKVLKVMTSTGLDLVGDKNIYKTNPKIHDILVGAGSNKTK
ncbi:hypothetical protein HS088_TW10G00430 [Tripterygium wilfordii]|uniref:Uncharacterized protein n=1 Tax=Tripterygium wilfordii TaxID=458696 RepID=A0A7J7D537_TRIWF|nr:hypothetical protein HS088_TW10G00430 [Tripterygium wilfordii]